MAISNTTPQLFLNRQQTFTSSGTFTHPDGYSTPRLVRVQCWGGGGGGAGGSALSYQYGILATANYQWWSPGGSGGNSGYYRDVMYYISGNAAVVVGAGGNGGALCTATSSVQTTGNNGTTGGNSSFGPIVAEGGGFGSNYGTSYTSSTSYSYGQAYPSGGSIGGMSNTGGSNFAGQDAQANIMIGSNYGNGNFQVSNNSTSAILGAPGQLGQWGTHKQGTTASDVVWREWSEQYQMANNNNGYYATNPRFSIRGDSPLSAFIAPGGNAGGTASVATSNTTAIAGDYSNTTPVSTRSVGMVGSGGLGGAHSYVNNGASTGGTGQAATGYSAGGGGGGGAISYRTGFTATGGAGGAGAPGLVIVSY